MNGVQNTRDRDLLSPLDRIGEAFAVGGLLLLIGFFVAHQTQNTGFFTEVFGTLGMVCLYGPLLFGLSAPAIRMWTGRRNPARPFEAGTSLLLAVGSYWLLTVFPLDYTHLADVLPSAIRFLLAWVTDDIARIVLLLQVIIGPISAVVALWKYSVYRRHSEGYTLRERTL